MRKWISILSGLLIVQLVLALTLNLAQENYQAFQPQEKLLSFEPDKVDGLRIEGEGESLWLRKQAGRWRLPGHDDFPADQANVKDLLDQLGSLEKGWPLATSAGAAEHFKVAEDDYQRRLTLLSGDQPVATLYVGTSPGFRKVHVRPQGDDAVYSVAFNTWEASPKADDWIDKAMLKLDKDKIERIEMPGLVLQRKAGQLSLTDLTDGQTADTNAIDDRVEKLADLRIQSLLGSVAKPEYKQDQPVLEIKLTRSDAGPLTYRFSKPDAANYYVLKRSDLAEYFKLPEYSVKPLLDTTREKLVKAKAAEAPVDMAEETPATEPSK
jgi:hypothetical protein